MREILCSGQARSLEFPYPGGMAALCWSPAGERGELTVSLHYDGAYGMGEKYNAVNQKGHTAVNEVEEKFCFQGEKTYCPAPFFWTNTGFGLYAATDERTSFRFGEKAVCAELPVDCRVVLFSGMPGEIIRDYMDLFGPAKLPPKWAFGPWISANHWDSQEKVERAVAQAEEHGFPVCALVAEAWSDEATFYVFRGARYVPKPNGGAFRLEDFDFSDSPWPDPAGMVQRLHEKGIRFLLWQIPVYKKQGPEEPLNAQNELDRADAVARGLCVHNADGRPYTIPEGHWFAGSMIPDFTNPAAEETWFSKRNYLTEMGTGSRPMEASSSTGKMCALRMAAPAGPERTAMPRSIRRLTPNIWVRLRRCSAGRATLVSIPRLSIGLEISSPRTASWPAPCGRGCLLP